MSWKELLRRYDELKGLSDEELDSLLGKDWAYIFKGIRDEKEPKQPEKEEKKCSDDYCEL